MGKVKTALARAVVFFKRISLWMISGLIVLPNSAWSSEAALQVAFVYNFAKFIDWPEEVENPSLRLCIVGGNKEMHEALDQLHGKLVNKRTIELIYLNTVTLASHPVASCQMVYQPSRAAAVVLPQPLPKGVVLVINEQGQPDGNASIVLIKNHQGRIEFEVNQAAISHAGVKVSSQLLKLAKNAQSGKSRL